MVVNDVRLILRLEAEDPDHAVRKARDTSLDKFEIGDKDEIEVWNADGDPEEFTWQAVEDLA
jgi:hypothetical protein